MAFGEGRVCCVDAAGKADGAGGVLDDDGLEAEGVAIDGGVADTEVVGEADEEEAAKSALAQVACEACGGGVVVFEEGRVAVDGTTEALAEDQLGVGDFERRVQGRAFGVLEAVLGPEGLRAVGYFDDFVGSLAVCCRKGDMSGGVPVLGEDDVLESLRELIDEGNDLIAFRHGERATDSVRGRAEIVLHVDDEKGVGGLEIH